LRGFRDIAADADASRPPAAQASRSAAKGPIAKWPSPSPDVRPGSEPAWKTASPIPTRHIRRRSRSKRRALRAPPQGVAFCASRQDRRAKPKRVRTGTGVSVSRARDRASAFVLILVGARFLWGKSAGDVIGGLFKAVAVVEAPKDPSAPQSKPKRFPTAFGQPSSTEQCGAGGAAPWLLYDEDPSDPKGRQYCRHGIWRTKTDQALGNQKADISPWRRHRNSRPQVQHAMSFRANTILAARQPYAELKPHPARQDFFGGGVGNVPAS